MNFHHLLEAVGILVIGLLFYSYTYGRLQGEASRRRTARAIVYGLAFGALSVAMMVARIEISPGVYIDARLVPVALIGLFEGGPAAVITAPLITAVFSLDCTVIPCPLTRTPLVIPNP